MGSSGYIIFLLMTIPVLVGLFFFIKSDRIIWWESLSSIAVALAVCSLTFAISQCSSTRDTETWSGQITRVEHTPEWDAEWEELETRYTTDSDGNSESYTVWVTKREHHEPEWTAITTIGELTLSQGYYSHIVKEHGERSERGYRPNYSKGDRNDYYSDVSDDPEFCNYPVTKVVNWRNPLKNAKGLHGFREMGEDEANKLNLFDYPLNGNFKSSRLLGNPDIDIWNWDKMNAAIGAAKQVNVILINCTGRNQEFAKNQEIYWRGGKKNDLVLCYGEGWSYVFGWSQSQLIKQNLMTILIDNPVDSAIIPLLKKEIRENFRPHEWEKYSDASVPVPVGATILAFIIVLLSQTACYVLFHKNEFVK